MIYFIVLLAGGLASESVSVKSSSFADCICDVTSGSCDLYCCCDSDCGNLVDSWTDECLGEQVIKPSNKCFKESSDSLEAGWRGMKIATDSIRKLFCVFIDNSAYDYNNFKDIGSGSSGRSYYTQASSMGSNFNLSSSNSFVPGEFVYVTENGISIPWTLPRPDSYGLCDFSQPVQWLVNSGKYSCSLFLNISEQCDLMSIKQFSSGVSIAGVSPKISRIFKRVSDIDTLQSSTSLTTSVSDCTCKNAVVQANFTIFSEDQSSISSINVELTVEDLTSCEYSYHSQSNLVNFLTNTSKVFYRSGNPGYQLGKNVIGGFINSENELSYYENGFQIPGIDNNGACSANTWYLSPFLTFGEDLIVNCYLEMNFEELKTFCSSENYEIPNMFVNESLLTILGKFGNLNASYQDDWIYINNATGSKPTFDEASGVCTVQTLLAYYIVYARIGNVRNPQNKIIYANREYSDQTFWQYRNWDKTQKQRFFYSLTFNFIEYEKNEFNYYPPPPNPLPIMPDDILYPFRISEAGKLGATFILFFVNF